MKTLVRNIRDARLRVATDPSVRALLDSTELPTSVEAILPDGSSEYAIAPESARLLARLVLGRPARRILELGAGSSSLVLARAMSAVGGGTLTSVESFPQWCSAAWSQVSAMPDIRSRMIEAKPRMTWTRLGPIAMFGSARSALEERGPFDFVFVDAPTWRYGRDGALPLVEGLLERGAWIVVDDARRRMERWTFMRWLRTYPSLQLLHYDAAVGERGVAIFAAVDELRATVDPISVATAMANAWELYRFRRRMRPQAPMAGAV